MSIWITMAILLAELAGVIYFLAIIALGNCSIIHGEVLSALVCALFGGVGGCVYCLRGIYINACAKNTWSKSWLPWYAIRPFVSLVMGGISYLFAKSGLLLLGADINQNASELGLWAIAFIAGLNVDKFIVRIEAVGQSVWGIEPSRQSKQNNDQTTSKEK